MTCSRFGTDPQGNVLIIQDLGETPLTTPDDDEDGGTFEFTFTDPVEFLSAQILDLDENVVPIFNFNGIEVAPTSEVTLGNSGGDNSLRQYNFTGLTNVSTLGLTLDDVSGAIASIKYNRPETTAVPEPVSALAVLAVGAVAVGSKLKKNKTA